MGRKLAFNAQSTVSVISGRNTIHLITANSRRLPAFVWRGFGENEVERSGKAEISRIEALAEGKACYARLYTYSRLLFHGV